MRANATTAPCRTLWRKRLALAVMAAGGFCAAGVLPALADYDLGFEDLPSISADELQEMRGGFEFAGLQFDFGASLRTFVDGRLALETIIQYTDAGVVSQHLPVALQITPGQPAPAQNTTGQPAPGQTTPVQSAPGQTTAGTGVSTTPIATGTVPSVQILGNGEGPTPAQLNLPGVDLSGLKDAAGILIDDRKGAVLALHEATRDRITSLVVNQASGRDIRQELDVSVTVQNFDQFRDTIRNTILNSRLTATPR